MGVLIDGKKLYEDDDLVVYSFISADGPSAGRIVAVKADFTQRIIVPNQEFEKVAIRIIMKAYKESVSAGLWPDTVVYAG
ncbi:hypothetical protein ACQEVI_12490 [Promicromonospora sp. CA-289599]|uniref:hypothetical protein n=1 Tax=Promicromonospora sp. CA-289599 TaxID=3240014 RepID=UPI003D8E5480